MGERGQEAIGRAIVRVEGADLAAEVCALYLAGAGVKVLEVDARIAPRCRALNGDVEVVAVSDSGAPSAVTVRGLGSRVLQAGEHDDEVMRGSAGARWALAKILAPEGSFA